MNIKRKLILLTAFLFSSCFDDKIEPVTSYDVNYFPMQVGNRWIYQSDSLDLVIEISKMKLLNSNFYFEFLKTYDGEVDTMLFRGGSNEKIFVFVFNNDEIFIDFNSPEGQIWDSFGDFYSKVNRRGLNIQTPAGNFENVIEIFTDNYQLSDLYEFNKYAACVGLVETIGFRRIFRLKSAFVNGITYP